jgi:hypothetical protein
MEEPKKEARKLSEFSTKELVDELCGNRHVDEVKKLLDERKI